MDAVFESPGEPDYARAVRRAVQRVVVERSMGLAEGAPMAEVRAHATEALERIRSRLATAGDAHDRLLRRQVERFLDRPGVPVPSPVIPAPEPPPGSPIGAPALSWLGARLEFCAWDRRPGF